MINNKISENLSQLFERLYGTTPILISEIKPGASKRKIFRLSSNKKQCIGIFNDDVKENIAFIEFSKSFQKAGFKVPEVFEQSLNKLYYLEQDLGDTTLANFDDYESRNKLIKLYEKSILALLDFQLTGINILDFSLCYQTKIFDFEQIQYDFTKFINYFVKSTGINSNLIKRYYTYFSPLANHLLKPSRNYFLYRDFQPRNIMIKNNKLYFIDYQSGRKGALQYDVASFLFSGSNVLTPSENNLILRKYIDELENRDIDTEEFIEYYYDFALIRLIQMLGSYAYLDKSEKKININRKILKAKISFEEIYNETELDASKKLVEIILENHY